MKTVDFSDTIAACDLKVGRCRQLVELMKLSIFFTLAQGYLHMNMKVGRCRQLVEIMKVCEY